MGNCLQKQRQRKGKERPPVPPTPCLQDPRSEQRTRQLFQCKAAKVPKLHLENSQLYRRRKPSSPLTSQTTLPLDITLSA